MNLIYKIPFTHWVSYTLGCVLLPLSRKLVRGLFSQSYLVCLFFDHWHLLDLVHFLSNFPQVRLRSLLDL